jgi:DNA replication protein DnaC
MDEVMLALLAKRLRLTSPDDAPEEYILTPEEEEKVLQNEVTRAKEHLQWKLKEAGYSQGDIMLRLENAEWNIDRDEILRRANSSKNYQRWQLAQREKEKAETKQKDDELKLEWTANKIFNLMGWTSENEYGKKFILNGFNQKLIKSICFFISRDHRFETDLSYSLSKGLLIRGISGLGKTFVVKCAANNPLNPIHVESMIEISDEIKHEGEYFINMSGKKILYLDDVGTEEPTVNHYGTKISFFKNFIEMYYLQNKPFCNLMISTNNSFSEMEEKYGFRVRSRIKDMFNIVDVNGEDMRG